MIELADQQRAQLLKEVTDELELARNACFVVDDQLRLHWASPELHAMMRADRADLGYGEHLVKALGRPAWTRHVTPHSLLRAAERLMPYVLFHAIGTGAPILPELQAMAAELGVEPRVPPAIWTGALDYVEPNGTVVPSRYSVTMLGHPSAGWIGGAVVIGSPLRASVLELLTRGDEQLFERIASLASPRQEPAAVLFLDLEGSSRLSRRLSTPAYFALISRVLGESDRQIAAHDGVVGKHAGDGATGFFRATDAGGASRAARNAIETARELRRVVSEMAYDPPLCLNIGLHFAPRLYLGQLITTGRLEVTALGDEVNECARVQESARGGTLLATKLLVEQLDPPDAEALGLAPDEMTYVPLAEWTSATDKARRDAGSLSVAALP